MVEFLDRFVFRSGTERILHLRTLNSFMSLIKVLELCQGRSLSCIKFETSTLLKYVCILEPIYRDRKHDK